MMKLNIIFVVIILAGVPALLHKHQALTKLHKQNQVLRRDLEQSKLQRVESDRPVEGALENGSLSNEQFMELLQLRGQYGVLRQEKASLAQLQADNRRLLRNFDEQFLGGKKLSLIQVAPYLEARQRNAQSLLAAARATGDLSLLHEALEKYPADPQVQFAAYLALKNKWSPSECRQHLNAFKQLAPENALANYLSAREYFKTGQLEEAVREMGTAASLPKCLDYRGDFTRSLEEVYQSAGCSTIGAKLAAVYGPEPHWTELRGLGQSLGELANRYRQAGDEISAQAVLQMGITVGRRIGDVTTPGTLIQTLAGIAIELDLLSGLDPAGPYDSAGQTVKDRLDELARSRAAIKASQGSFELLRKLPEPDQISFLERMRVSGEWAAMQWTMNRQRAP